MSPFRVSASIHGLFLGYSTYRRSRNTLTSVGSDIRAGGAGAAGAALAAPLFNSNIISSMGRGSAEPPKILLPYLQWPPHFSWASDAPE